MRIRFLLLFVTLWLTGMLLSAVAMPTTAQQPIPTFVTNTPQPTLALPVAASDQYALRGWQESDLLALVYDGLNRLMAGDASAGSVIRLTLYELAQRFPGAPHDSAERARLLEAMLNAPRGSVDMRTIARPFIEAQLNASQPDFSTRGAMSSDLFTIEIFPADFDGDAQQDAVIHSIGRGVAYEDYTMASRDAVGVYHLYESSPSFPAAPLYATQSIRLERVGDVTGDGIDELVVLTTSSDNVNAVQMLIYGVRGGQVVSLSEPAHDIRFGRLLSFPDEGLHLSAADYRLESPAWGCISEITVTWTWMSNLFRYAVSDVNNLGYVQQNSLACALYQTEPLFSLPPREAITRLQGALAQFPFGDPGTNRAGMVLSMLYMLEGSRDIAIDQAQQFMGLANADDWLMTQAQTLIAAASDGTNSVLDVCAAMQQASAYGACDVNGVLARVFSEQPLRRDGAVVDQLEERGLQVLESAEYTEAGRAPRTAVHFSLAGANWWAFAPTTREFYTAEALDAPPAGYETAAPPPSQIGVPAEVMNRMLVNGDISGALALLENVRIGGGGAPLSAEALYVRALGYDLLFDRNNARQAYFDLWASYPSSIWGQFAAAHLEQR
ncbi:MAG: hypothetical protein U0694_21525 [Anaerolineae bacterium]